jgi:hypothetical protein
VDSQAERDDEGVDPVEFVRRALAISPEDAETVQERTPGTRKQPEKHEGPTADYGDK